MTQSNGTTDGILDKVRKILNKAEDPACTPAEAEAFTAKAAELIAKYGIDRAMLAAADPTTDRPGDLVVYIDAPFARDKAQLLTNIAAALRCKNVMRTGMGRLTIHLFGYQSDLERVDMLYTSLLVQMAQALLAAASSDPWGGTKTAAWKRSWMFGYASAVYHRLRAAEARAEQQQTAATAASNQAGPSVALVLVNREDAVERALQDAYPNLKKGRRRQLSGGGRQAGYRAGQRANLGGTGLGQSQQRALGAR